VADRIVVAEQLVGLSLIGADAVAAVGAVDLPFNADGSLIDARSRPRGALCAGTGPLRVLEEQGQASAAPCSKMVARPTMRSRRLLSLAVVAVMSLPAVVAAQPAPTALTAPPHIVLVGDSTVTEGSGWGLGFRGLVAAGVTLTNAAQNGRSSKSFREEGHWGKAIAAKGQFYLIQFGHNDQPGKGPERETDPATTYPANLARYVDEVRAIGATPILVTSLVRRTFAESDPARLTSTLGPWVEAVKKVAAEKQVVLIDLDASSRALCERLGPADTKRFDLRKDDGTWDTTHLDATGSTAFARLVVDELRQKVPSLAPYLLEWR
jgi:lysophospholipase L1-like esterase